MRLSRCSAVLGAVAVILASTPRAYAERAAPHVVVSAPSAALCPTESELVSQVEARLMPASVVDPKQHFEVAIEAIPNGMSARLVVRDAENVSAERIVEAESCEDVFDTVAFIVAMTIDPETAARPSTESASAPTAMGLAAAPTTPAQPNQAAEPPPDHVATGAVASEAAPSDRSPRGPASSSSGPRFELGALAEGTTAIAPGMTPAGRLFGGVRFPEVGFVYPSLRLSATRSMEQDAAVDDERGGYLTLTAGRLEICGSSGFGSAQFVVDLCPAAEIGVREGEGYGVNPPKTPASTWFSLNLLARLGFLAGDWVLIEVEGGLVVPVTRDTFVLRGPDAEVFETPAVALSLGGGVALRLP